MRNNVPVCSSFEYSSPDDIDKLPQADVLISPYYQSQRSGLETWSCAWAPDGSYFAWSCGNRCVQLIPWDRENGSLTCKAKIQNGQRNCPHRVSNEHCDVCAQERGHPSTAAEPLYKKYEDLPLHVIDCGDYVWSITFGSGTSYEENLTTMHQRRRLRFDKDLIVATGLQSGKIKLWNCLTGKIILELLDHKDIVRSLSFTTDGSLILCSASRDGTFKFWDLNDDGNMFKTIRTKGKWNYSCKWSPNSDLIALSGNSKSMAICNMKKNYYIKELIGHYHDIVCCEFSPDGGLVATASYDTRVIIWDPYTCDSLLELGHLFPSPRPIFAGGANDHYVRGISFSSDGMHLVSISDDGYVRYWNLEDTSNPEQIAEHSNALCCSISNNGHTIAVGNRDGDVRFYNPRQEVPSLQHLSRMAIRKCLDSTCVDHLHLPIRMKEYLKYHPM